MPEQMWSVKQIADNLHTNTQRIYRAMGRLEIEPTETQKNVKYYSQEVLEAIAKELGSSDQQQGSDESEIPASGVDVIEAQKNTIAALENGIKIRDEEIEDAKRREAEAKHDRDVESERLHMLIKEQMEANTRSQTLISQEQQLRKQSLDELNQKKEQLLITTGELDDKAGELELLKMELEKANEELANRKKSGFLGLFKR